MRTQAEPDYSHWLQLDYLNFYEAALLAYGIEPKDKHDMLFSLDEEVSFMGKPARKLYDIMDRSKDPIFKNDMVAPAQFFEWAMNRGIELPARLEKELAKIKPQRPDLAVENQKLKAEVEKLRKENEILLNESKKSQNKSALTRVNKSFMAILGAIAQEHYKYDPNRNNPTVGKIKSHIQACGLNMDEQTIKDRLSESLAHITEESKK